MALKKPTAGNAPATTSEGSDTAVVERPAVNTAAPETQQATPAAQAETTTALAKASSTSLAVADAAARAKAFERELRDMKGASDFSYGNYAKFKGNNGSIAESGGEEADLGRWAKVRLMSWDESFEVSPGESGGETKDFVAYSKDGKVIDSVIGEEHRGWVGKLCDDYVEHLRTVEEFAGAKKRRFIDTACALLATDSGDGPINKVIQVTLSESSIPSFSRYQQELNDTARCVSMNLPGFSIPEDPFTFYFIREVASKGSNKWTKLRISADLPAKV